MRKFIAILAVLSIGWVEAQTKVWTLQECVEYALENNITVNTNMLNVELSEIDVAQAKFNFLPNLNANASYNINTGANINPATNQFENETFKSASGGASSGVNIFSGLQNWKNLQRAKLNEIASQYQLEQVKDDITLFVVNAFLDILFNKEQLKILAAQDEVGQVNFNRTQELVDAGVLPEGDLLEIRANNATLAQQIIAAENALFISRLGLAQLLQLEDYENFRIVDADYDMVSEDILLRDPETITQAAKEERNEIKLAEANFELARKDIEVTRTNYYPSLSGFVSYNTRWSSSQSNPFTGEDFGFIEQLYLFDGTSIGLRLQVPIFNGFQVRNNVARSKVNAERFKLQLDQANLNLEADVYQAYNDAKNAKKAYEAAVITAEARELAFDYATERYNVGLSNAFDYNQSRAQYENAQSEVIRAKYDYIFKLKLLEFYFGVPITDLN